jgi:hypothetical protein
MQINSAQDYLTMKKRQLIASTFASTPPPPNDKRNGVYLSVKANQATTRQIQAVPVTPGGTTVTSWCSGCEAYNGVFTTVNVKDVMSRQALRPIGVRATISQQ